MHTSFWSRVQRRTQGLAMGKGASGMDDGGSKDIGVIVPSTLRHGIDTGERRLETGSPGHTCTADAVIADRTRQAHNGSRSENGCCLPLSFRLLHCSTHVTRHRLIMTIFTSAFTAGQNALRSSEADLPVGERTTHALRR